MTISAFAAGFAATGLGLHVLSAVLAGGRCRKNLPERRPPAYLPPISIVQPLCGVEPYSRETLASIFALDYPEYEIVFCISPTPRIRSPRSCVDSSMRIPKFPRGCSSATIASAANPKLNNVVKGWKAARHAWIVMADSNVLMPPDYLTRLISRWRPDTGIVCSPPIGSRPENFVAHLECAFLNTYQARWQYAAESVGYGFAQGKTMLYRRDVIEAAGGIEALGVEIAEDAASTKLDSSRRDCTPISSIAHSRSRSARGACARSGSGSCAGRGFAASASRGISDRKSSRPACSRCWPRRSARGISV